MSRWCWRCSCDKHHKHHHHQNHRIIALHSWSYNGVNISKTSIFQLHFTFTSSASVSVLTTSYTTMSSYHVYLSTCPFPLAAIPLLHQHPTLITAINRIILYSRFPPPSHSSSLQQTSPLLSPNNNQRLHRSAAMVHAATTIMPRPTSTINFVAAAYSTAITVLTNTTTITVTTAAAHHESQRQCCVINRGFQVF